MARIPDHVIQRLKEEISLQRLAEAAGVSLSRRGKDWIGLCPFHNDTDPSLVIDPKKNLWNCFGACGEGGSVIDWVMKAEKVSFRHAVEILRDGRPLAAGKKKKEALPCPFDLDAPQKKLLGQVIRFYHKTLKKTPDALAYLQDRGLTHPELARTFQLGFANRTLGYRLPSRDSKAGRKMRDRLQAIGILKQTGHELFRGSVVVPLFDAQGEVVEVYGRKISTALRKSTPRHLYLPGPHKGIFNRAALTAASEIILCESLIDAMTFWSAGFRNVTAAFGTNGVTDELFSALTDEARAVLLAFDADDAGKKATDRLATRLQKAGCACFSVRFPKGMDANEYAQKVTPAQESLGLLLRKAAWLGNGEPPERQLGAAPIEVETSPEPDPVPEPAPAPASSSFAAPSPPSGENGQAKEPAPEAPAAPRTRGPKANTTADVAPHQVTIRLGDRAWRVRGLKKNRAYHQMKVNLLCSQDDRFHVDTFDLYAARRRQSFINEAKEELGCEEGVLKRDLGRVLLKLEELQDEAIRKATEPKETRKKLNQKERKEALEFLKSNRLIEQILADFNRAGIVGEELNTLCAYLVCSSRKLKSPLAAIVQSTSAAGKSSLMDAALAFVPPEDQVKYSAVTGQALFYMGETELKHKVLAICEEEGAERATYALKLLLSEKELTIASTGKDPTGKLDTQTYRVEGPVAGLLTTTAAEIDEELQNRCLVLAVSEDRDQTRAIHARQRHGRTLEGLVQKEEREAVCALHQNAQRLLRPLRVVNPFASELTFFDAKTRTRRDHEKYLGLIDAICLLHQYQRPLKEARTPSGERIHYIEATLDDVALANRIAAVVLGRSLDELPPQTRRLLFQIEEMVQAECRRLEMRREDFLFTRREVREWTGRGNTQLKVHLRRLVDLEYLSITPAARGLFHYELLWEGEGKGGQPFLPGLVDIKTLRKKYDSDRSGPASDRSGSGRPPVGARSAGGRGPENGTKPLNGTGSEPTGRPGPEQTAGPPARKLAVPVDRSREV